MYHHRNAAPALVNHDLGGKLALLRCKRPELAHEVATIDTIQQFVIDAIADVAAQSLFIEFVILCERIGDGAPHAAQVGARIRFGIRTTIAWRCIDQAHSLPSFLSSSRNAAFTVGAGLRWMRGGGACT